MGEETKTEIVKTTPQAPATYAQHMNPADALIAQAIEKGLDITTMERLMAMRKEIRAEQAKEAFDTAMSLLQGKLPTIKKQKDGGKTKTGQVAYKYAQMDSIVDQTKAVISEHGFSHVYKTEFPEGKIKVTCVVKHTMGHMEESFMEVPMSAQTEIMSKPQTTAATVTFAKRYAFCNAYGIVTGDDDTDAAKGKGKDGLEKATTAQRDEINKLASECAITFKQVADRCKELYGVSISEITPVQADGIILMLKKKLPPKA